MLQFILKRAAQPLGLALEWYWEYLILAAAVIIIYKLTFSDTDELYASDEIRKNPEIMICRIFSRILFFLSVWAIVYGAIWLVKLIILNWITSAVIAAAVICTAVLISLCVNLSHVLHSRRPLNDCSHKTKIS